MAKLGRLENEHRSIALMVTQLTEMVDAPDGADRAAFVELLSELATDIVAHFEFEEKGGVYSEIASQRASFDRKIAQFLQQHLELRQDFSGLLAEAKSGAPFEEIGPRLRATMERLGEHEKAETELVQEAYLTDLGDGD